MGSAEAVVEEENGETEVGDGVEAEAERLEEEHEAIVEAEHLVEARDEIVENEQSESNGHVEENGGDSLVEGTGEVSKVSMEDRLAKLRDLRIRMVCFCTSPRPHVSNNDDLYLESIDSGEPTGLGGRSSEIPSDGERVGSIGETA